MGLMDKFLAKQELSVNKKIVSLWRLWDPKLTVRLSTAACQESSDWTHQSIEVHASSGAALNFHRCRNVWFVGSGFEAKPVLDVDLRGGIPAGVLFLATYMENFDPM